MTRNNINIYTACFNASLRKTVFLKSANVVQLIIILSWFPASLCIFVEYLSNYLVFQSEVVLQFSECNLFSNPFCLFWLEIIIVKAHYWQADKRFVKFA